MMLSPDDMTQVTGPLEQTSSVLDRQSTLNEQRSRQTSGVSAGSGGVTGELGEGRAAYRQMLRLRQENRRLHLELEGLRQENRQLYSELAALRSEKQQLTARSVSLQKQLDEHLAAIHSGHWQETEQDEGQLRESMEELRTRHLALEQRYQELQRMSLRAVEAEARRMIAEALYTLERSPERVPPLLTDLVRVFELRARSAQEQELAKTLSLKQEVELMAAQLEWERQDLEAERKRTTKLQETANEQAKKQESELLKQLRIRWTAKFAGVTLCILLLFLVLQLFLLSSFHLLSPLAGLLLIVPIVICMIVTVFIAYPRQAMKRVRARVSRKKVVKKDATEKKADKK